ncbi:protein-L-isoaspartate O-methyltransferase [Aurantiacibacter xanthus]|uniref:Protein-L-isoaspartate O-methyltransferase n=1 Tax=Aurantiacibacter xanthus TaxID=1784712 RepID=A0A3A1PHY0_9SPHN|nr:protein-L-isoaspartate O-methyltransferase [Aurantiacibacter xanthus]RIV92327.1 protein-L-isoaspartate O-methyltransferase [Aurantiacibacter xanthus]
MLETTLSPTNPARRAMIDSQLRTSGVNAPEVLARMNKVPREDFVPESARATAYMDRAIKLDNGGALPAPLVQGAILQEAAPRGSEVAIVVNNGSGYLAELLRPMVAEVIELTPAEALAAGTGGKPADLLLVDGAAEQLPEALLARLADDARIVTGTVEGGVTRLAIGRLTDGKAALFPVQDMGIPRIAAFDAPKGWTF